MNREEELLTEKRRYNLPEEITTWEKQLLKDGVPIQKIIGFIDFDDLKINVNRDVLIPRYETVELVNESIKYINEDSRVLDLCTGSGYIGLTIKQKTNATVVMSDIDEESIIQSTENAKENNLDVEIIQSNLFENIEGKFDVIVTNPPYIPATNILDSSVTNYEPSLALFGGKDGNAIIKKILNQYKDYLNEDGVILFEASPDNINIFKEHDFEILKDINGKERIFIKK